MALTVETGSASSSSESYASVAFGDTYVTNYLGNDSDWASAAEGDKENALRVATFYIDNRYRGRWKGTPTSTDQALAFPRIGLYDENGYAITSSTIPIVLQRATVEMAKRYLEAVDLEPDVLREDAGIAAISERFDVFSESVKYVGARPVAHQFAKIDRMLSGLIDGAMGQYPVERG